MINIILNLTSNNPHHEPPSYFIEKLEDHFSGHDFKIIRSLEDKSSILNAQLILGWPLPTVFLKKNSHLKSYHLFSSQVPESYQKLQITVKDSKGLNAPNVVEYIKTALPENWREKKLLILGKGHIGSLLGLELNSPNLKYLTRAPKSDIDYGYGDFENLVSQSDIIIPTLSLNQQTASLFEQERFFENLKKDVFIINTTRGKMIDEKLIFNFFSNNPDAFYHTDVTDPEPYPQDGILRKLQNCKITDHIAGFGGDYWDKVLERLLKINSDEL